ncbi:MAG: rhomboid family intramembrane serine protease [Bryobacter sp.]|nr:rhomboid family intramembrane serine protease [Bryobacter sp.]
MRYTSGGSYTSNFDFAVPRGIKLLLIANIGLFLLYFFADFFGMERLFEPFQLIPAQTVERLFFWQPFTYLFLHDPRGVSHILLNMLMLFFAGKTLEETWGFRRFLRYYFLCGIGAALCVIVYGYVMGEKQVATIGASGSIFGLLLAFGMLFPDAVILLGMIFPIKAKYAVMIMGAIAFLGTLKGGGSVSHIAHLGGMLCGFLIIRAERKGKNVLGTRSGPGIVKQLEAAWRDYKLKRAKRKFEVYMNRQNKQNRGGGPYVQ